MINRIGIATLCKREIWRFLKVWNQTIIAPVVTTLLFLAVLVLAMGGQERTINGAPYSAFIAPGLVMMAVVQNAFANTSSSLMLAKIQGVIIDFLMPPLTGAEVTFSLLVGGVVRGLMVGLVVMIGVYLCVPFSLTHPGFALFHLVAASSMLALLGIMTGVWSQSFDQLSAITNYIITPLAFLSGTFYSIEHLPEFWRGLCHYNPFFYMIDGFRYAIIGASDTAPWKGVTVMVAMNVMLWSATLRLFNSGYRLKN